MASGEPTDVSEEGRVEQGISRLVDVSELVMEVLELLTGVVLVFMFVIGLYDLVVSIVEAIQSGAAFQVDTVVDFIDTVLLLLIIVEVFRTVVAFAREETVVRIIIDASLVAIARKIIGFRPDQYGTTEELFVNAATIAVLLLSVIVAFYVVRSGTEGEIERSVPAAGIAATDDGDSEQAAEEADDRRSGSE